MKIKNNPITWLILTAIVMLVFPWLTITFIKGDAGMAVCFILFFVINPLFSIISGVFAGRDPKKLWVCPLMTGILFRTGRTSQKMNPLKCRRRTASGIFADTKKF